MDRDQHEHELLLNVVERKLAELKLRWPAHSLQPALMAELEDLEEEQERLQRLLDPEQVI